MSESPSDWRFDDSPYAATISTVGVVWGGAPILFASHSDQGWYFSEGNPARMEEALLVCLSEIVQIDSSVTELADLPFGWEASRERRDTPWHRLASPPEDAEGDAAEAHSDM